MEFVEYLKCFFTMTTIAIAIMNQCLLVGCRNMHWRIYEFTYLAVSFGPNSDNVNLEATAGEDDEQLWLPIILCTSDVTLTIAA